MIVAVIPARGGSKRIPKKNIKNFFGKPIISYSIKAAIDSKLFDKVIGSQPSLAYDIDKDTGKEVLKRPLRREYLDFVLDNIHDEELSYQQLKDFAIRHKIIPPS